MLLLYGKGKMEQVYTDLSPEQRPTTDTFNSAVRELILDLEETVTQAQREIDRSFSGYEKRRLARQATEVKRAITLLKESILS